jgi:hypothetical protein
MRGSLFGISLDEDVSGLPRTHAGSAKRVRESHPEREEAMTDEQSDTSRTAEEQDQPQDARTGGEPPSEGGEQAVAERGADSPETGEAKAEAAEDDDKTEAERESEKVQQRVKELEDDPPEKLEDWPEDEAKYETFGGPEGEHGYHEGPEQKLGPSALRHREDGSVEIEGEEVDNPEEYKAEPIPGGPTDPDTANLRMDKASPDDVSDVARKAAERESGKGEESEGEESEGEDRQ